VEGKRGKQLSRKKLLLATRKEFPERVGNPGTTDLPKAHRKTYIAKVTLGERGKESERRT